jgi:hypothetical protein
MVILFFIYRLIFLIKIPIVLGGDESYEMNAMLQNILQGNFANVLEYVQPHHYFGSLIQALFTLPFHFFMPTNEFGVFLGITFIQSITTWFALRMVTKYYNKSTTRHFFISLMLAPIGIIITSISSDTAGNATLSLTLFLLFDRLLSNDDSKKAAIISLFAILVDISFFPIAVYVLLPHLKKIKMVLTKEKFSFLHAAVLFFLFFESFIVIKLIQKTLNLSDRITHYNFKWSFATSYQHFLAEHSLLLFKIKPLNVASIGLFLLMLILVVLFITIKKPLAKKSKEIAALSFYFFIYSFIFYLLKTDEPYATRTLAINSEYWQLWFYSTLLLIVINLNFLKNIRMNFYAYLILSGFTSIYALSHSGLLNNFLAYNLNFELQNPRPKIDTIDSCTSALEKYHLNYEQKQAATFGCNAREQDPTRIKSLIPIDGLFYFGIGIQKFYRNDQGVNLCLQLIDNKSISECMRGYQHSSNILIHSSQH